MGRCRHACQPIRHEYLAQKLDIHWKSLRKGTPCQGLVDYSMRFGNSQWRFLAISILRNLWSPHADILHKRTSAIALAAQCTMRLLCEAILRNPLWFVQG
ncbi:unnamed protein product [Ostreobium quekettii]|uniref:Uncharacterized protein n=1 Tax=Ostreobium quekettii TaxID=121088 RepID=A0A8S1J956_9CHLO|nr:unnamed protein product [Ostreobium quekettii]